jgi:aspartyl/asparaginyl-tRNA synthetase
MEPDVWVIASGVASVVIVIVVALLRDRIGETKADELLKQGQTVIQLLKVVMDVAEDSVLMVEGQIKQDGGKSGPELHAAAVTYASKTLSALGINVDQQVLEMVATACEAAYQRIKNSQLTTISTISEAG